MSLENIGKKNEPVIYLDEPICRDLEDYWYLIFEDFLEGNSIDKLCSMRDLIIESQEVCGIPFKNQKKYGNQTGLIMLNYNGNDYPFVVEVSPEDEYGFVSRVFLGEVSQEFLKFVPVVELENDVVESYIAESFSIEKSQVEYALGVFDRYKRNESHLLAKTEFVKFQHWDQYYDLKAWNRKHYDNLEEKKVSLRGIISENHELLCKNYNLVKLFIKFSAEDIDNENLLILVNIINDHHNDDPVLIINAFTAHLEIDNGDLNMELLNKVMNIKTTDKGHLNKIQTIMYILKEQVDFENLQTD